MDGNENRNNKNRNNKNVITRRDSKDQKVKAAARNWLDWLRHATYVMADEGIPTLPRYRLHFEGIYRDNAAVSTAKEGGVRAGQTDKR